MVDEYPAADVRVQVDALGRPGAAVYVIGVNVQGPVRRGWRGELGRLGRAIRRAAIANGGGGRAPMREPDHTAELVVELCRSGLVRPWGASLESMWYVEVEPEPLHYRRTW